ncbi:NADPH-dependent FMN reductase [Aeromicrobium sp. CF3.5]|uniref:NADPH-dependent FMN reductase n=1 Tax=Aeromicrobium sp. CF3.5 TaxID=3373078 RepID=UPI003EE6BB1B
MTPTTTPQIDPPSAPVRAAAPLRLTVISGSVRDDRIGPIIAGWAAGRVGASGADARLIDLANVSLPDDRHLQPGGGPRSEIADTIDESDGFVIVTPEYNHSYPGSLKRAIDWHHSEWMFKAATVISYGARGGLLATEHLRGVFAELHLVTTRNVVGLSAPWNDIESNEYHAPEGVEDAVDAAVTELTWWCEVLRDAREQRPFR